MTELIRGLLAPDEDGEPTPAVLDAEALRSLATVDGWASDVGARCVLTPHVGEFLRLRAADGVDPEKLGDLVFDDARRLAAARDAAKEWRQVVVLKGAHTVIAAPDGRAAVSPFDNPALATAGTGDVLAGTIGALLAQGLDTFEAAQLGVYLHAMAGESVRARLGDAGLLASDLPPELPLARKKLAAMPGAGSAARAPGGANAGTAAHTAGAGGAGPTAGTADSSPTRH
jgi:NAD(P)H-hydrate epimerase